jgi:hypothetical protein
MTKKLMAAIVIPVVLAVGAGSVIAARRRRTWSAAMRSQVGRPSCPRASTGSGRSRSRRSGSAARTATSVTSYEQGGTKERPLLERFELNFARVEVTRTSSSGETTKAGWDVKLNQSF